MPRRRCSPSAASSAAVLLLALSTFAVATATSSTSSAALAEGAQSASGDAAAPAPAPPRLEPASPLRLRLGVTPMEYGSRVVDGGDGYALDGGWTYGLDAQALYSVGRVVELGVGGAWDRTEASGFSTSTFDALRVFASARFHASVGDGVELGVAPRLGYAFVWADTIPTRQAGSYRRSFRGLTASLALDARVWLDPRVALFAEIDFRAITAPSTSLDSTQGPYFATAQYWGFGVAPTFGAIFAL